MITVENLTDSGAETDFYAIKTGDLNYSATTNNLLGADDRSFDGKLTFTAENQQFNRGEIIEVPIRSSDFESILGFQFSLAFDVDGLSFEGVIPGALPDLEEGSFGYNFLEEGVLTGSWFQSEEGLELNPDEVLFVLKLIIKFSMNVDAIKF